MYKKILLLLSFAFLAPNLFAGKNPRQRAKARKERIVTEENTARNARERSEARERATLAIAKPSASTRQKSPERRTPALTVREHCHSKHQLIEFFGYDNGRIIVRNTTEDRIIYNFQGNSRNAAIIGINFQIYESGSIWLAFIDKEGVVKLLKPDGLIASSGSSAIKGITKSSFFAKDPNLFLILSEENNQKFINFIKHYNNGIESTTCAYDHLRISADNNFLGYSHGKLFYIADLQKLASANSANSVVCSHYQEPITSIALLNQDQFLINGRYQKTNPFTSELSPLHCPLIARDDCSAQENLPSLDRPSVTVRTKSNYGELLCTGYSNGDIVVINTKTNKVIEKLKGNSCEVAIRKIACKQYTSQSGDDAYFIAWAYLRSYDNMNIIKYKCSNNQKIDFQLLKENLTSLKISKDSDYLLVNSEQYLQAKLPIKLT